MLYKNKKTGMTIDVQSPISGDNWTAIKPAVCNTPQTPSPDTPKEKTEKKSDTKKTAKNSTSKTKKGGKK